MKLIHWLKILRVYDFYMKNNLCTVFVFIIVDVYAFMKNFMVQKYTECTK